MNDLARVARATNHAEAEFVQALLLEAGSHRCCGARPGSTRPTCSPPTRDVIVPSTAHDAARQVLLQAEIVTDDRAVIDPPTRGRLPARALRTLLQAMRMYPPAGGP